MAEGGQEVGRDLWYNTRVTTKSTVIVLLALAAFAARAERQPFSRYQSILDRQMFGELPAGFDPTKMPSEVARGGGKQEKELTKEQEKLQSSIHFSMINVTPDGSTAVGFTDNSNPKSPVHYYLKVGESRDGWRVEEADAKAATMTIVKDDVEVSLSLGGNSGKGAGQTQQRGAAGGAQSASGQAPAAGGGVLNTLRGRRALRERKAEAAQAAAVQKLREEQAAKEEERAAKAAEERAQREAEREEQRKQLQAIQEELRKAREEASRKQEAESDANDATE